jgi:CrcB protein
MIYKILLVGLGGGAGSVFRYLASVFFNKYGQYTHFPLATFTVNILGCLLIGFLIGWSARNADFTENLKLLLITGFCGGYTTFSTFSAENLQLLQAGNYFTLIIYTLASILVGLFAVYAGSILLR